MATYYSSAYTGTGSMQYRLYLEIDGVDKDINSSGVEIGRVRVTACIETRQVSGKSGQCDGNFAFAATGQTSYKVSKTYTAETGGIGTDAWLRRFDYTRTFTWTCASSAVSKTITVSYGKASISKTVTIPKYTTYAVKYRGAGSGLPAAQTKAYGRTLVLSSQKPTLANYTFLNWSFNGTNTYYSAGSTLPASRNELIDLITNYRVTHTLPTISNVKFYRCDSGGQPLEEGTFVKISFDYAVCTTAKNSYCFSTNYDYSNNKLNNATVVIEGDNIDPITLTQGATNLSTGQIVLDTLALTDVEFSPEQSYTATITVQDTAHTASDPGQKVTTAFLSSIAVSLDIDASGMCIGLGRTAPDLEGSGTTSNAGTYIANRLYMEDPSLGQYIQIHNKNTTANTDTFITCKRDYVDSSTGTLTTTEVRFGVGSGGKNHGVWSTTNNNWLIYTNSDYDNSSSQNHIAHIQNHLLQILNNGNALTIGSNNTVGYHIYGSPTLPFYFNSSIGMVGNGTLGTSTYPAGAVYNKGVYYSNGYKLFTTGSTSKDNWHVNDTYAATTIAPPAKTGYTPIGIIGYNVGNASTNGKNASHTMVYNISFTNSVANVSVRTDIDAYIRFYVYFLYIASAQGI